MKFKVSNFKNVMKQDAPFVFYYYFCYCRILKFINYENLKIKPNSRLIKTCSQRVEMPGM